MVQVPESVARETKELLELADHTIKVHEATIAAKTATIEALTNACSAALKWVENMRIVPGGDRARLRDQLRSALSVEENEAEKALKILKG